MSRTKITAILLAVLFVFSAVRFAGSDIAEAATKQEQQYFLDTVGPMCTADMKNNRILASFTMAQAIQESGWGTSTLAKEANALFGVRATARWDGLVYDRNEKVTYGSWQGLLETKGESYVKTYSRSFWRAYESWQESVTDRSDLFNTASNYANLRGNYDYKSCAKLVVEDGYCSDPEYTDTLIYIIEKYDLSRYDYDFGGNGGSDSSEESSKEEVKYADSLEMDESVIYTDVGGEYKLSYKVSPSDAQYTLTSSDSTVASVKDGKLVAKKTGKTTVTLTSGELSEKLEITVKSGYGSLVVDGTLVACLTKDEYYCIPKEATAIADDAFKGSRVQTVVVGDNVKKIADDAFDGTESGFSLCAYGNSVAAKYAKNNSVDLINFASKWSLDSGYAIASGIPAYTTASLVGLCFAADGYTVAVRNSDGGSLGDTDYVGSGCELVVDGKVYLATVKGDTDGDGLFSDNDYAKLAKYIKGSSSALSSRPYRRAADMNEDSVLSTVDYIRMRCGE